MTLELPGVARCLLAALCLGWIVRDAAGDTASRLVSLSIRSTAGSGDQTLIVGFALSGDGKPLLVRGVGPSLVPFGVAGALSNPELTLYSSSTVLASNDDWGRAANASDVAAKAAALSAFPLPPTSKDAALLSTFNSGLYTAHISSVDATSGIALVELYDADATGPANLTSISARTQVGVGENSLIAGFVIAGRNTKTVLLRGVGPSLANYGVGGVLADPQLSLRSGDTVLATNDNWRSAANASQIVATSAQVHAFGLAPGTKDAALLVNLAPGLYTAQVTGVSGTQGVALLEVYDAGAGPTPASPFVLSPSTAAQTVYANSKPSCTITATPAEGFAGDIALSVSGLPAGATARFNPATISAAGASNLNITTTTATPAGTYTLTVSGTGGGVTRTTTTQLIVAPWSGFVHPGILTNRAQLDKIKAGLAAGDPVRTAAFNAAVASSAASLSYTAHPWATVECGSNSNPNYGCSDERNDAIAAYTHALLWYLTGNEAYARKSIEIMTAWSTTLTGGHINSNAPLQTGWSACMWPAAAELIRASYPGWSATEIAKFQTWLKTQYLPTLGNAACKNGNWELIIIEALMHVAIFTDDKATFDKAVGMWRARVPAYMYLTSDGPLPVQPPGCAKSTSSLIDYWQGQSTFVDGLAQETCRDFGHTIWGFAAAASAAETAYQQGFDLWSEESDRILTALEFHANYLLGAAAPNWLCGGNISLGSIPTWEIAYNHLHNRLGLELPLSQRYIAGIRPTGFNYFMAWETLTHAEMGWTGLRQP